MRHNAHVVLGGVTPIRHRRRPSALAVCMESGWRPPPSTQRGCMQSDTPLHPYTAGTCQVMSDTAQRRLPTAPYSRRTWVRHQPIALWGRYRTVRMGRTWCVAGVVDKGDSGPALMPLLPRVCGHEGMWPRLDCAADDLGRGARMPAHIQRRGQTRELPTRHSRAHHGGVRRRTCAEHGWPTIPAGSRAHACCSPAHAAEARSGRRAAQQSSPIPQARQSLPPEHYTLAGRPYVSQLRCDTPACSQTCPSHRCVLRDGVLYATLTWAAICHG
jgi:hypothetical protein